MSLIKTYIGLTELQVKELQKESKHTGLGKSEIIRRMHSAYEFEYKKAEAKKSKK